MFSIQKTIDREWVQSVFILSTHSRYIKWTLRKTIKPLKYRACSVITFFPKIASKKTDDEIWRPTKIHHCFFPTVIEGKIYWTCSYNLIESYGSRPFMWLAPIYTYLYIYLNLSIILGCPKKHYDLWTFVGFRIAQVL